jgi:type IV pilus assembly protein PilF
MKNSLFLVLCASFIISSCANTEKQNDKRRAEILFSQGTESLVAQSYTEALTFLLKAEKLDPDNADIHNNLGMAFYFKKDLTSAKKHLTKAIELDENQTDAKGNLASLLVEEGRLDDAETIYKQILKNLTYDKQARTYYNLGVIQQRKGIVTKAETYFQKSIKESDTYCPAHYELGLINFNRKNFKEALQSFKDAGMGVCVDSPGAFYQQAMTYIELQDMTRARQKLEDVVLRFGKTRYGQLAKLKLEDIDGASVNSPNTDLVKKIHNIEL